MARHPICDRRTPAVDGLWRAAAVPALLLLAITGCTRTSDSTAAAAPAERTPPAPAPARDTRPRIVFLGDSLTAGLGVTPDEAYPAVIQRKLRDTGHDFEVINAGVSGDTTAGGLRRLNWSLRGDVRVLVVALGGNDGLRGLPVDQMRQNLASIIETARARHIAVLLAGMEAPPNFGPAYTAHFRAVYTDLARTYRVPFIPFFIADVAGRSGLNQNDGIHPTAEGQRLIAERVWRHLEPMLAARSTQ